MLVLIPFPPLSEYDFSLTVNEEEYARVLEHDEEIAVNVRAQVKKSAWDEEIRSLTKRLMFQFTPPKLDIEVSNSQSSFSNFCKTHVFI